MTADRIPVTVLTGFLGAGKTTLLNRLLTEQHGLRIAVIENEFGEVGIDHQLVVNADEEIFEMNNGCICCTVRGDLIRILGSLLKRRDRFDRILVETTGLADPGPVAQTFLVDPDLARQTRLDGIVTVVDAANIGRHLDGGSMEAREQIAFADVIVLNKADAVDGRRLAAIEGRVRAVNAVAPLHRATRCAVPLDAVLGIGGFDLDRAVAQRPGFLEPERGFEWLGTASLAAGQRIIRLHPGPDADIAIAVLAIAEGEDPVAAATAAFLQRPAPARDGRIAPSERPWRIAVEGPTEVRIEVPAEGGYAVAVQHDPAEFAISWGGIGWTGERSFPAAHEHDDQVSSVGISTAGDVDVDRFNAWFTQLIRERGADLYRCKGILAMAGSRQRFVFHGVHMLTEGKYDRDWRPGEARVNQLVFIGRQLDRAALGAGFRACLAEEA